MLGGLRKLYLQRALQAGLPEHTLGQRALAIYSELSLETSRHSSTWATVLRNIMPEINNIFQSGAGTTIRSNQVYASEPAIFISDLVDFLFQAMFSETTPWFRGKFITPQGVTVDRSLIDHKTKITVDEILGSMRYWIERSGFYEECKTTFLHDFLLGNAALQSMASWQDFVVADTVISRLAIGRDSAKRVETVCEIMAYEDWEIMKRYGQEALMLFERGSTVKPGQTQSPLPPMPTNGLMGGVTDVGGSVSPAALGSGRKVKEVVKLNIPNTPWARLPFLPEFPEMGVLCILVTRTTGRILDVEAHPVMPFGITRDTTINGESYGRGLGMRLLPVVSVLNSKKRVELNSDAIQSQSPLVVKGPGFVKQPGALRPYELLQMHGNSDVTPLFDRASLMQRSRSMVEDELMTLERGVRKSKMEIEYKSHMTASEFTTRKDDNLGIFTPTVNRFFRQAAHPILNNLLGWMMATGKAPPLPTSLMQGRLKLNLETYSVFSAGADKESAANIMRAFGPLWEFIEARPDLLDNLNFDKFLRSNLTKYELSKFTYPQERVDEARERRYQQQVAMQKQQVQGAAKGRMKAQEESAKAEATMGGGGGSFVAV